jgi:hypothetical protein
VYLLISKKNLEKHTIISLILKRPTPVLRKIHKMGAPLFCF